MLYFTNLFIPLERFMYGFRVFVDDISILCSKPEASTD